MDNNQIVNRYYNLIESWVESEVRPEEVEDVTQDVMERVLKSDGFRGESKVETWLYRITRNHIINHRQRNRDDNQSLNCGWEDGEEKEDHEQENHEGLSDFDSPDLEAEKIQTPLTPTEEQMIELFGLGFTYSQIGSITNKTPNTVSVQISQAKNKWISCNSDN